MSMENANLTELLENGGKPPANAPMSMEELKAQAGVPDEITKASELVDTPIILHSARSFQSRFSAQDKAYFVTGVIADSGEAFASVFGGGAVVETIATWQRIAPDSPLSCVLRQKDGGRWGRYYVLE